jgi:hypothetical protein
VVTETWHFIIPRHRGIYLPGGAISAAAGILTGFLKMIMLIEAIFYFFPLIFS